MFLLTWVKPVASQALAFMTVNAAKPNGVMLKPFYAIHHERYTVYWQFSASTVTTSAPCSRRVPR